MKTNLDAHIGYGIVAGAVFGLGLWKLAGFSCEKGMIIGIASGVIGSLVEIWMRHE